MGFKSTVKKGAKTASKGAKKTVKTASKAQKEVKKVANTPIVKTAVTAVATAYGGESGAQMVDNSYSVINSDNPMDSVLGASSQQYLVTKGYINQFKDQSSPLSTLIPASSGTQTVAPYVNNASGSLVNGVASVSSSVQKKSLIYRIFEFFGF